MSPPRRSPRGGTPTYVYSAGTLLDHYRKIAAAYAPANPITATRSRPTGTCTCPAVAEAGAHSNVVSGGELHRDKLAGADMKKIVFAGVGKTDAEIDEALDAGILSSTSRASRSWRTSPASPRTG